MKPIEFKEQTIVFAKDQPQYQPLPAAVNSDPEGMGEVISCWKLSWRERFKILFTGKMWSCLCMFGKPLTPSYFTVNKKELIREDGK